MRFVIRFVAVSLLLLGATFVLPPGMHSERAVTATASRMLAWLDPAVATRTIRLRVEPPADAVAGIGVEAVAWSYRLSIETRGRRYVLDIARVHLHATSLVVVLALALTLPSLGWLQRCVVLTVGVGACLFVGALLLLNDVGVWEQPFRATALAGVPPVLPPSAADALYVLHGSRSAEVLPIALAGMAVLACQGLGGRRAGAP